MFQKRNGRKMAILSKVDSETGIFPPFAQVNGYKMVPIYHLKSIFQEKWFFNGCEKMVLEN